MKSNANAPKIITILLVCLFCIVPVAGIVLTPSNTVLLTERRMVTPLPQTFNRYIVSGLGNFIKDRLLLRADLLPQIYPNFVRNFRTYDLNNTTPVKGSGGFWFCGDNWNYPIAQHTAPVNVNIFLPLWEKFAQQLNYIKEKTKLPLKILMPADKHGIYSEYLPPLPGAGQYRFANVFKTWAAQRGIDLYDAYDDMRLAKSKGFTHYHQDTHWTSLGAYYAYLGFMRSIGAQGMNVIMSPPTEVYRQNADLMYCDVGDPGADFYTPIPTTPLKVTAYATKPQSEPYTITSLKRISNERFVNTVFENPAAPYPQTVLLIGDSTSEAITPFFFMTFKKVVSTEVNTPLDEYIQLSKQFSADFIVFMRIERCLTTIARNDLIAKQP